MQAQDEEHHFIHQGYDQEIQATVAVSSSSADAVPHATPSKYNKILGKIAFWTI